MNDDQETKSHRLNGNPDTKTQRVKDLYGRAKPVERSWFSTTLSTANVEVNTQRLIGQETKTQRLMGKETKAQRLTGKESKRNV